MDQRPDAGASPTALYTSLPLDYPRCIRLLDLIPGPRTAAIRARLRTVSIDASPQFEALSYRWGSDALDESLIINDHHTHHVTASAFAALQSLRRRRGRTRTLWVDAICIDQSNEQEKSQQVPLMGDIYRSATVVNVWLGRTGVETMPLLSGFFRFKLWKRAWRELREDTRAPTVGPGADDAEHKRLARQQRTANIRFDLQLAWHALCGRHDALAETITRNLPWHERVWIVQEYIMARRARFGFGFNWVSCDIAGLLSWVNQDSEAVSSFRTAIGFDFEGIRVNMSCSVACHVSMGALQNILRTQQCKMPQDKIYGMRSLIDPYEAALIPVDYTVPCWKVFAQATYAAIRSETTCRVLDMVSRARPHTDLPSWSIDFAHFPDSGSWPASSWSAERLEHRREQLKGRCVLNEACNRLRIKATPCDVIVKHSPIRAPSDPTELDKALIDIILSTIASDMSNHDSEQSRPEPAAQEASPDVNLEILDLLDSDEVQLRVRRLMPLLETPAHNVSMMVHDSDNVMTDVVYVQAGKPSSGERSEEEIIINHVKTACLLWESLSTPIELQRQSKVAIDIDDAKAFLPRCSELYKNAKATAGGLSFFSTTTGMVGIAPFGIERGDLVVLTDENCLLVLKPQGGNGDEDCVWRYKGRGLIYSKHAPDSEKSQELWNALDEAPWFTLC